eukprot:TRINITY_DN2789_c0_g2::TRINITY_DN2789_c0_g2_i1::g.27606::m.27606 TRINITY_DN2789_c0_g2::TRINITY_DN2789_c0_g2_i1::g.27606  ORF type:complete len:596 (-),score=132.76,sp/C0LGQ5/GSO1_ARATH/30.11/3e-28,sp/C0LGQ5/GSO1_ARATH/28.72/2e-20,sp/C0LGQ5/GSO1_ARATH/28.48/3e-18,sp/C0LGQ5/GSO1_ARATH/26.23/1e-17,sp/C0LGQ5/GSO1_ARATH/26.06/2e-14,sp/C0LGQ5/GSO1_ARATH/34.10/5e-14,sp/C0LGQ5/GSO1_ARATH/24.45/2e-13,sp/C0LGQ5/GSO1_ARATH/24.01/6e-13,sp/C0LGQ5/GSO1_ARATH/23.84/6e-13,sp/C0LGQ5/GSO1_ARATH/29.10/4e-11,LRR_4/P
MKKQCYMTSEILFLFMFFYTFSAGIARVHGVADNQADALNALYMSTNGELWRNSSGWHTTTTPVCDWFGVACDEAGNAISLTLNDNGLNGTLPEELAALQTLTKIDVRGNYLSGDVPQSLATSPTLDTLYLKQSTGAFSCDSLRAVTATQTDAHQMPCQCGECVADAEMQCYPAGCARDILRHVYEGLNGPQWEDTSGWLTDAPVCHWHGVVCFMPDKISAISLVRNNLGGTIPEEISQLTSITLLNLFENNITGTIPAAALSKLPYLQFVSLQNNNLSGTISAEFGDFPNLISLSVSDNQLEGTIPRELAKLPSFNVLIVSNNRLVGTIPEEFGSLEYLLTQRLKGNQLSGEYPRGLAETVVMLEIEQDGTYFTCTSLSHVITLNTDAHSIPCDCGGACVTSTHGACTDASCQSVLVEATITFPSGDYLGLGLDDPEGEPRQDFITQFQEQIASADPVLRPDSDVLVTDISEGSVVVQFKTYFANEEYTADELLASAHSFVATLQDNDSLNVLMAPFNSTMGAAVLTDISPLLSANEPESADNDDDDDNGLSTTMVVIIAVCSVGGAISLALAFVWVYRRRKSNHLRETLLSQY